MGQFERVPSHDNRIPLLVQDRVPNPCLTKANDTCIFPFTYNGVEYYRCTYADSPTPWCATRASPTTRAPPPTSSPPPGAPQAPTRMEPTFLEVSLSALPLALVLPQQQPPPHQPPQPHPHPQPPQCPPQPQQQPPQPRPPPPPPPQQQQT